MKVTALKRINILAL